MTRRHALLAGVRAIFPLLLGALPFATISGIAAVEAGLSPRMAMFMSVTIFAGASQLAAVQLIKVGAAWPVILLTALVINLRFAMYGASIAPHFRPLPARFRALLAYVLSDQAYAVSIARFQEAVPPWYKGWFFLGAAASLWLVWQGGTAVGIVVGAQVPPSWGLDFAIPLTFLALAVPLVRDRPALVAALVATLFALLAYPLPFNSGLLVGAGAGILAGLLAEQALQR